MDDNKPTQEDLDNLRPMRITASGGALFVNPGTGSVNGATEANAIANMVVFIQDCIEADIELTPDTLTFERIPDADYGDGRYAFNVTWQGIDVEVQMPGWALDNVRWMSEEQNIWDFPRLYVDGSSWIWKFAILSSENFRDIQAHRQE